MKKAARESRAAKKFYIFSCVYLTGRTPVDRDPVCGYTGIIENECPHCHRKEIERGHMVVPRMKA